ncbi:E3 Ubiquitin ligase [Halogranum amylolyticum]|uniref:RING-type E3 ubiquitin transferase n=1 Tax=Halogranum amylolyticum TaxID=660520 RepID=A0A1H8QD57_9EURY|nr:GIDE domain-containing protein [Halogranum amylolyticum]SEO51986.1 E3 Ubiquitin ligase [Halogranum amylolyticum]
MQLPFFGVRTLVAVAFVAVGGYVVVRSFESSILAVRLLRTGRVPVRELMEETGRQMTLVGTVEAVSDHDPLVGPFSGRPAVVVGYEVREERTSHDANTNTTRRRWETIDEGWAGVPFVLADDTASVRVDPADAQFTLGVDESTRVAGGRRPPERIRSFVETNDRIDSEETGFDVGPIRLSTGRDRKYVEYRLEVDDEVTVLGTPRPARGEVGRVNAVVDGGSPFVVVDTDPWSAAVRLLGGSLLPLLFGGLFAVVGLLLLFGGRFFAFFP